VSILTVLVRRVSKAAKGRGDRHEPNRGENNAFHGPGHGDEGIGIGRNAKAGILLAAEGLAPTSKGARVKFNGDERTVIDGPFTETKELVAGFSIIKVKSLEDAIELVKRTPNIFPNGKAEVEIRKLMDVEDFGEAFTPNPEIAQVKFK
jgi:hypothetical protein